MSVKSVNIQRSAGSGKSCLLVHRVVAKIKSLCLLFIFFHDGQGGRHAVAKYSLNTESLMVFNIGRYSR